MKDAVDDERILGEEMGVYILSCQGKVLLGLLQSLDFVVPTFMANLDLAAKGMGEYNFGAQFLNP